MLVLNFKNFYYLCVCMCSRRSVRRELFETGVLESYELLDVGAMD